MNNRFPNFLDTSTDNVVEPDRNSTSDWELEMARLVGLNEEELSLDEENNYTSLSQNERIEPDSLSTDSPQESRTEQSISANPLAKFALVATGTLVIVLLAGAFLSQLLNGGHRTNNQDQLNVSPQKSSVKSEYQDLSTEVETLKTKLALSEQVESMKTAQETLRRPLVKSYTPNKTSTPSTTSTPSVKIVYVPVPKVVTVDRIVKITQPVRDTTPVQVSQAISKPTPSKPPNLNNINPSVNKNVPIVAAVPKTVATSDSDISNIIATIWPTKRLEPNSTEDNNNKTQTKSPIALGTTVKGVLATSVFGETTLSINNNVNEKEKNMFVIRLEEPLKSLDGTVVLPQNTELLATINSISEHGLLQLNVMKAVMKNRDTLKEIDLPKNALTVSSVEGQPLIADQHPSNYDRSSNIAGLDLGLFLLGGLGKAAELINRADSQVAITNSAGSIISSNNPQKNVAASFAEGGFNSLVPQIAQRNQQAIAVMSQKTNIWFLPAETRVEIHVNQALQF